MRTLLLITTFLIVTGTNAQISLSARAGWSFNTLKATNKHESMGVQQGGHQGWKAGLHAEYALGQWFIYTGLQAERSNFYVHEYYLSSDFKTTYHPLYLSMPLGGGYTHAITRKISGFVFAGLYAARGIGGKVKTASHFCGDFTACVEPLPTVSDEHGIDFNGGNLGTLAPFNAGLQFGAGIKTLKKWQLSITYNAGLNTVIPGNDYNRSLRLHTLMFDAGYRL